MAVKTPDLLIFVMPETLTDKSVVYNVTIGPIKLAATTEDDAGELAERIREAIDDHATQTVDVVYE